MKVQVAVDGISYRVKIKDGYEIDKIKERTRHKWTYMDTTEVAKLVGNEGHAFLPGHLVNGKKAKHCVGMQLFVLDFDTGISFMEIQKRCNLYNLPISFAYHTFSSSEKQERFRLIFVHETLIEDTYIIKVTLAMLHKIFPESDKNCINMDRLFLGGKKLIHGDENASFALVQLLSALHVSIDTNNNYKRNLQSFCRKQNILMVNNKAAMGEENVLSTIDKNDDFMDSAIIHIIGDTTKSSFFVIERKGKQPSNIRQEKRKLKRVEIFANKSCQLLEDFLSGKTLDHNEKFLIISNMRYVNGGEKVFLEILEQYYDSASLEKWKNDLKYMCGYKPKRCSADVCPYFESCNQNGTIVDTISVDRRVYKTKNDIFYPLEDAVECLKASLEKAYQSKEIGVHLIKAQTSIGKTTQYIDLIM